MIKYIGSKRKLVPLIQAVVRSLDGVKEVVDLFSGTARVGHGLKSCGYAVKSNDINSYARVLATCYVQADLEEVKHDAIRLIQGYSRLAGRDGYFTETFCRQSRFFQPHNGARVDAIRDAIAADQLEPDLEAVVLTSLMEAADRVDSTTGVQMAYLKEWAPRAHNNLELRLPKVLPRAKHGKGSVVQMEAMEAASCLTADVGYLDPPYNQHKYIGNYHIWETLVRWDSPEPYGIAMKRIDCRDRKSAFNSKPRIHDAVRKVLESLDVKHLVVSFNNEGYISKDEMIEILSARGDVHVIAREHDRYVGAQIGIHNLKGERVGEVSHLTNTEYIYVVPDKGTDFKMAHHASVAVPVLATIAVDSDWPPNDSGSDTELDVNLLELLEKHKSLTNSLAQGLLKFGAAELRASFSRLVESGKAYKTGQRRGTVYHLAVSKSETGYVPKQGDGLADSSDNIQLSMFN